MLIRKILLAMYKSKRRLIREFILRAAVKIDHQEWFSPPTLREIFRKYHDVEIGRYTHGFCFTPGAFDRKTKIGRYCSIAAGVVAINHNHRMDLPSSHALFYNSLLGYVQKDSVEYIPLIIGSDVWIGQNAIIMPAVTSIGHGAVIAAGSVVNKNIPPYAVVVGNPARIVRYRFTDEKIKELLKSEWWNKSLDELDKSEMTGALEKRV